MAINLCLYYFFSWSLRPSVAQHCHPVMARLSNSQRLFLIFCLLAFTRQKTLQTACLSPLMREFWSLGEIICSFFQQLLYIYCIYIFCRLYPDVTVPIAVVVDFPPEQKVVQHCGRPQLVWWRNALTICCALDLPPNSIISLSQCHWLGWGQEGRLQVNHWTTAGDLKLWIHSYKTEFISVLFFVFWKPNQTKDEPPVDTPEVMLYFYHPEASGNMNRKSPNCQDFEEFGFTLSNCISKNGRLKHLCKE